MDEGSEQGWVDQSQGGEGRDDGVFVCLIIILRIEVEVEPRTTADITGSIIITLL